MQTINKTNTPPVIEKNSSLNVEIDIDLILEVLNGVSFTEIAKEREYSVEFLETRFKIGLHQLAFIFGHRFEKKAYDNYMDWSDWWMEKAIAYRITKDLQQKTGGIVNEFYAYFKGLRKEEQKAIFSELEKIAKV